MTQTQTDPTPAEATPAATVGRLSRHLPEMLLALTRMQTTMFDAALRQNIEWLDFLKARFERDRQLVSRIGQAAEPQEAAQLWAEFWRRAAEDYADEPRRLSQAAQAAVTNALSQARADAETILHPAHSTAL